MGARIWDYEVSYKDGLYELRLIFMMVITNIHIYPNSFKMLFPWKLLDVLKWMHIDYTIFTWGPTLLSLIYRYFEEI